MKASIVTTTINLPTFLCEYYANLRQYGHPPDEVRFIVIGDNRTSKMAEDFVEKYLVKCYPTEYWPPEKQDEWLRATFSHEKAKLRTVIPENDMRRRNFGYLRALELNSDITITIDDDNYPLPNYDWLGLHFSNLKDQHSQSVSSANSFLNPCRFFECNSFLYSRGYPFAYMFTDNIRYFKRRDSRKIALNLGLWTGKPDVDSYTNLIYPDLKTKCPKPMSFSYTTEVDNYFPINTQNTSFVKELAIFHNLFMEPLYDLPSHRFDDIWAGLFCLKLIHKKGQTASFGTPLVEHRRNTHDYQKDLQTEFIGAALNTKMWEFIRDFDVHGTSYDEGFLQIADGIERDFAKLITDRKIAKYVHRLADSMRLWIDLLNILE